MKLLRMSLTEHRKNDYVRNTISSQGVYLASWSWNYLGGWSTARLTEKNVWQTYNKKQTTDHAGHAVDRPNGESRVMLPPSISNWRLKPTDYHIWSSANTKTIMKDDRLLLLQAFLAAPKRLGSYNFHCTFVRFNGPLREFLLGSSKWPREVVSLLAWLNSSILVLFFFWPCCLDFPS